MEFTFGKDKKLKSKLAIERLFAQGTSLRKGALRCVYQKRIQGATHQVGVSVSKRYFKKAPDRNRVKRLLRESYRLQQHSLQTGQALEIMFLYQSKKLPDYEHCFKLMKSIIKEINKRHSDTAV